MDLVIKKNAFAMMLHNKLVEKQGEQIKKVNLHWDSESGMVYALCDEELMISNSFPAKASYMLSCEEVQDLAKEKKKKEGYSVGMVTAANYNFDEIKLAVTKNKTHPKQKKKK